MSKKNLLISEPPLQVLPSLAKAIGLNEAIVIQQIHYWLENPKAGVERNGHKWVFNTYEEWQENFPFWSIPTIQRTFASLEENGFVIAEQFDKHQRDMRKYYRISYDQLDKLEHINLIPSEHIKTTSSKVSKRHDVNKESETTTETTPKNTKGASAKPKANTFPELILFREVTKRYPHEANWEDVVSDIAKVSSRLCREVTKDDLMPFYKFWTGKGYNPYGLGWIEWAVKGETPKNGKDASIQEPRGVSVARSWLARKLNNG